MAADYTRKQLHTLPSETLQQIAHYLYNSHGPSLNCFALVNKSCHDATLPVLFQHVYLTISNPEDLHRDVNALSSVLIRTNSAGHVRCFSIEGELRVPDELSSEESEYESRDYAKSMGHDEILGSDMLTDQRLSKHFVVSEDVIERCSNEDIAWAPAAEFISTLPYLTTLIYDCKNQFPPSLLDALHNFQPQCRLHHLTFRFRSLLRGIPEPYEMALATSPCLYKVKVEWSWRDSNLDDDSNLEAIMELAAGLAPHLREVEVLNNRPHEQASRRYFDRPRKAWTGLPGFVRGSIGSLTSLSLTGKLKSWSMTSEIRAWAQHTDFGRLVHLRLGGDYGLDDYSRLHGETIHTIAQEFTFPQLKTLQIGIDRVDMSREKPEYSDNVSHFFKLLEPLEELSVSGSFDVKILDAIISRHGQTLKKLAIRPGEGEWGPSNLPRRLILPFTFTEEHILQIDTGCPVLDHLALVVKRTHSDAVEANIYKSFGQIRSLRSLFLTLDCSEWRVTRDPDSQRDPLFDAFDRETYPRFDFLTKGSLRKMLSNCAVDETLARSIWETINRNKLGLKLEYLKLWTTGGGHWGNGSSSGGISKVVEHLSRSWLIERRIRDDERHVIDLKELGQRAREARDDADRNGYLRNVRAGEDVLKKLQDVEEESPTLQVLRRVWPRTEEGMDWRDDWSSLPLQV
ncbi:hypothetical protein GLAREA_05755 [Glarea lozoyensis ATCC 20868]|uniref:Uncharacterized protein n=1 Tax=Glarea lozoyensis (strain ATCC 20868 / MF5171) TaxID=1116229 RepID=S3DDD2_GLAL2|nr:uncharacterized protein GLAREA_05755 [Glarea lozoyensis ATCC 20868]EPE36417.1 hypothetical protein GLAREA_05755 [Glarea lozoyensis ATCC 20868]